MSVPLNLKYLQSSDYAQALFCARHLAIKAYIQPRQLCLITYTSPLSVKFEYSHCDLQLCEWSLCRRYTTPWSGSSIHCQIITAVSLMVRTPSNLVQGLIDQVDLRLTHMPLWPIDLLKMAKEAGKKGEAAGRQRVVAGGSCRSVAKDPGFDSGQLHLSFESSASFAIFKRSTNHDAIIML